MRQLSPPTNLLLACLAALGLLPVLGTPWYAPEAIAAHDAPKGIEGVADLISRWFSSTGPTTTGADALGTLETALLGVAAATVVLCLAMFVTPLRPLVREVLPVVPLAAPIIVVLAIVAPPGGVATAEMRWGSFAALALTGFMASAAIQGAQLRDPKPTPRPYAGTAIN